MKIFKNYLLFAFSVLFAFYLCELFLNFNNYLFLNSYQKKLNNYSIRKNNKPFDFRSSFDFLKNYRKKNARAVLSTNPKLININSKKFYSLSGLSNRETISCNDLGYYMIYRSDRYGFNNPDSIWNNEQIDYMLVGDSFVHGYCVNRPNDIASIMSFEKKVINLGYAGSGPLHQLAITKEYFFPSKKILWFFYEGNDLSNLESELNNKYLKEYLRDDFKQELKFKQNLIDEYLLNEFDIFYNEQLQKKITDNQNQDQLIKLKQFLKLYKLRLFTKRIFIKENIHKEIIKKNYNLNLYQSYENILKKMRNFSIKNNSELYLIYLPTVFRYEQKINFDSTRLNIKKIAKKNNVNFIDLHSKFFMSQKAPTKYFSPVRPGHLNTLGYKKISNVIMKIIEN